MGFVSAKITPARTCARTERELLSDQRYFPDTPVVRELLAGGWGGARVPEAGAWRGPGTGPMLHRAGYMRPDAPSGRLGRGLGAVSEWQALVVGTVVRGRRCACSAERLA